MERIVEKFLNTFGDRDDIREYSAPGRVEIGGNHTDHQGGCVLAAAINMEVRAIAALNGKNVIAVKSEGYPEIEIDISDLSVKEEEKNTTSALIRGVLDGLSRRGVKLAGADMYIVSNVLKGSGLSSSAAFEVLLVTALSDLFGAEFSPVEKAIIGQYAESVYFGKPCGLMDQTASASGGICAIDFSTNPPHLEKIEFDFAKNGYDLAIIDAGADHADLTEQYAEIPNEMRSAARCFGKEILSEVTIEEFFSKIKEVREKLGDRATLRAVHFLNDTRRAKDEAEALKRGDLSTFLALVSDSGASSFKYLQNIYVSGEIKNQAMAFAIAVCEKLLDGEGAVRIQGGGFGGTIEAFVPKDKTEYFKSEVERILGKDACRILTVRNEGGVRIR